MQQISFADAEFAAKKRVTRRERFLAEMEQVVPWAALLAALAPHDCPGAQGRRGRPPIGLERMLRLYFLQQCFGLSDEGLEDAIYDSQALRGFLRLELGREAVPDATTLLGFRHLLAAQGLTELIFETVNAGLRARGLMLSKGTVIDATIIAAPPSRKNRDKARDAPDQEGQPVALGHVAPTSVPTPIRGGCTASAAPRPTWPASTRRPLCCTVRRSWC